MAGLRRLPLDAQYLVNRTIGAAEGAYHVSRVAGTPVLADSTQGYSASFAADGITLHAGTSNIPLEVQRFGYGAALAALPKASAITSENQVTYDRGALQEWYVNGPIGPAQGFTISKPPKRSGNGWLTVQMQVGNGYAVNVDATAKSASLSRSGHAEVSYGACGSRTRMTERCPPGSLDRGRQ